MRGALAIAVVGAYTASLCLAGCSPLFYDLAILLTGVILGIVINDSIRGLSDNRDRTLDLTPGLTRVFQEHMLNRDPEKTRKTTRLRQMLDRRIRERSPALRFYSKEAKDYIKELGPEVLDLYDDVLWTVVNEGEHYAFRNPTDTRCTIVMRKEFAEKALVLGVLP